MADIVLNVEVREASGTGAARLARRMVQPAPPAIAAAASPAPTPGPPALQPSTPGLPGRHTGGTGEWGSCQSYRWEGLVRRDQDMSRDYIGERCNEDENLRGRI